LENALRVMYERLANFLVENLDFNKVFLILEAGCGSGQLTIPLVKRVNEIRENFKVIGLDVSAGPYKDDLDILRERVQKDKLEKFVMTVEGDVRNMEAIKDESVDLVISNELFCDLDRDGLESALKEFYRVLRPNGRMAHGELNPTPENEPQKLLIEANAHSLEVLQPKPKWFSPSSDEVAALLHKTGFKGITVKYFETNVKMNFNRAMKKLKEWKTDPTFIKKRLDDLKKYGLEFPMEHIIFCRK